MQFLRRRLLKLIVTFLIFSIVNQTLFPTMALALTGGPTQPEVESFAPMSATDMVNLFTGDFSYNIPLLEVGGYPLNLIYNSNPTMDQEASWVGLGWNINPGSITRSMRGVPDDFRGDTLLKEFNIKDNKSWGVDVGVKVKSFGYPTPKGSGSGDTLSPSLAMNLGVSSNNYRGYGISLGVSPALSAAKASGGTLSGSLGLQFSSQDGMSISASAGIGKKDKEVGTFENTLGLAYNNRAGLKELSIENTKSERKGKAAGSKPTSVTFSFGTPSFTPTMNMPLHSNTYSLAGSVGGEIFGVHGNVSITGYWSKQTLQNKVKRVPAYGYLHSSAGSERMDALMDMNREKDIAYNKSVPNLPVPSFTHDVFSANAHGMSGNFRPYRGDVGILFDHLSVSGSSSTDAGIQLGLGNLVHGGGQINQVQVTTTTKKWNSSNALNPVANFVTDQPYQDFESSYFKSDGELTLADTAFYRKIGDEFPMRNTLWPGLVSNTQIFDSYSVGSNSHLGNVLAGSQLQRTARDRRVQLFSHLTTIEASMVGLDKYIFSFKPDSLPYKPNCIQVHRGYLSVEHTAVDSIPRNDNPSHHISEITITKPDGRRFIYGIPAYNRFQRDVTFACKDVVNEPSDGLIDYSPGVDNASSASTYGLDNYFSAEQLPPYTYSHLLTGVVSPDYIDKTGNGITSDDAGEAVRFNYSRLTDAYRWRVPHQENKASINRGLNAGNGSPYSSTKGDAKASYSYGTKDLWYVHSIESKTMLAMFYLQDREDALGVKGENGGYDPGGAQQQQRQKFLKEIRLYSKSDLMRNGNAAVPVKSVHFVYDYSLCPGVPNNTQVAINNSTDSYPYYVNSSNVNEGGKLTLRKVYFTYGNNTKGQLNSYQFHYSAVNPSYGMKKFDRWGNYKDNSSVAGMPLNSEFPYTLQDTTHTNPFVRAWNLEEINLPSGGSIKVQLESDEYAYVQDRRAGQMFFLDGFARTSDSVVNDIGQELYNNNGEKDAIVIWVGDNSGDILRKYLDGLNELYCRMEVDMGHTSQYDYSSHYLEIDRGNGTWFGTVGSDRIWVKVKLRSGDNPISRDCWQFLRNYLPEVAYPGSSDPGNNLGDALLGLLGSFGSILDMIQGFPSKARKAQWGKFFNASRSWVRLHNPNYAKLGGGSRVKSIVISDNWHNMAPSGVTKEYGHQYLYVDTVNGQSVSTGVASWEPIVGADENPFRLPVRYEVKRPMVQNDHYYMEEPFCESYFPAPVVGYAKIQVASFSNDKIRRTATGYEQTQFYTARDFPVITSRTSIESRKHKPPFKIKLLNSVISRENWLVSQGYSIELNDMHGKERAKKVFNAFGHEISSVYYNYKSELLNGRGRLTSQSEVITPDGSIFTRRVGEDIDFFLDMREQNTNTTGFGLDINSEGFILPIPFPLFILLPPILPKYTDEKVQFRSVVAMKVIRKNGVLESVVATKDGSTVETRNLLRDSETGEVLLTKTSNEFSDPIYNWTYPAHWAYHNMGPGFSNTGLVLKDVTVINGVISMSNAFDYLNEGDELLALRNGSPMRQYIVGEGLGGTKRVISNYYPATIQDQGAILTVDLKVIRSGKRNMQTLPVGTLAMVNDSPIDSSVMKFDANHADYITQSSITEYNDLWKIDCQDQIVETCDTIRPEFCLAEMINHIINYNMNHSFNIFNACYRQNWDVGDIYEMCNCMCKPDSINGRPTSSMPFYNPNCEQGIPPTTYFEWAFGPGCKLIMRSLSGNPINLDSLQLIDDLGDDTSCVKVYEGTARTDSASFCVECRECDWDCVNPLELASAAVPYKFGMKNNWHQWKNWSYHTYRNPLAVNQSRIRDDGYYSQFTPFWQYDGTDKIWKNSGSSDVNWVTSSEVTRINKAGTDVENKDALGNYSSALYGYRETLPKTVASNSRHKQQANDNFEDYDFLTTCIRPCFKDHFSFLGAVDAPDVVISDEYAHTGKFSLKVAAGDSAAVMREIHYLKEDSLYLILDDTLRAYEMYNGCMDKFSPDSGKYILSAWVREATSCGPTGYSQDSIRISYTGSTQLDVFYPSGVVIEGWQRYYQVFDVPGSATEIIVTLCSGSNTTYFDDIRIHPYDANMKSYVYDAVSLRLMSELDANNYATFYEYDDEGKLVRVKKETERGILTLKESRQAMMKQ